MFKGFQSKNRQFNGFPNLNFQQNNEAYGFSGCTFWLDAAYGLNTQTDLAAVSSWQSRIGGITFIQATAANQPRFVLNDPNFNNLPSVQVISTARFMTSVLPITISSSTTFCWISKPDSNTNTDTILGSNAAYTILLDGGSDNAAITGAGLYSNTGTFTGTTEGTNPRIALFTYNNVYYNGVNEKTGTYTGNNQPFFNLFRYSTTTFNYTGRLAELLVFNYKMTPGQMQNLSDNINLKYAIY